jgi:hypothetical protein
MKPTGTAYRIPRAQPGDADPRVRAVRALRRKLALAAGVAAIVVLCFVFPRVLAFAELAAREIRYLWWLVAILALGVWLAFFVGRKKD